MKVVVAITGASGVIYGVRFLEELGGTGAEPHLIISENGERLLRHELGLEARDLAPKARACYPPEDVGALPASGSAGLEAMVIIPCSMRTLSMVATGSSSNLIGRAADVMLKEGRPLVLVIRETPLSPIHLENMLKLARLGVRILPASPGFYHKPSSVDDLVNHVVGKVMDALGFPHQLFPPWRGESG